MKLREIINAFRVKRAIKKAERLYKLTRFKYIVINWQGKPKVFRRKELKYLVQNKVFQKHISLQTLENTCIYKTY